MVRGIAALLGLSLALAIGGCDYVVADRIEGLRAEGPWQALPMRSMLSRPGIRIEALEFCRSAGCGYDAVVARIIASGGESERLRASLTQPQALSALLEKPSRAAGETTRSASQTLDVGAWHGLLVSVVGHQRRAYGIVLEKPVGDGTQFLVVVSDKPDVARALARSAAG